MQIDFHTHILPGVDDGSPDVKTSLEMLRALKAQGIDTVVLTPHFMLHQTDIDSFLEERDRSYRELLNAIGDEPLPKMLLGAEVYLENDLDKVRGLERLKIEGTQYMMIEFPYMGFIPWMVDRTVEICAANNCMPLIAHLDRFRHSYRQEHLKMIADNPDLLIQLNASSMLYWKTRRRFLPLVRSGRPLVFGSDTHNMENRPPRMDACMEMVKKKIPPRQYKKILQTGELVCSGKIIV